MKQNRILIIGSIGIFICCSAQVYAKSSSSAPSSSSVQSPELKQKKGVAAFPGVFRVKTVTFKLLKHDNAYRVVTAVQFNKNIDVASVRENGNIRLIRKNDQHFWVDASTQNNVVRVRPNIITWVSGAPAKGGYYKMLLRGTIKSKGGIYLDCDGDGKGEGGALPGYESQLYQIDSRMLEVMNTTIETE